MNIVQLFEGITTKTVRCLLPLKNGHLTAKERMIAKAAVATGEDPAEVARRAGVSLQNAYVAMKRPAVRELMLREQQNRLINEALPLAVDTLIAVMSDRLAARGHQIRAAEVAFKYALKPGEDTTDKDPSQMTGDELHQLAQRLRRELSDRAKPVIDQEPGSVFE